MTLQIQEGRYYRTASGEKVGPMERWVIEPGYWHVPDDSRLWFGDGSGYNHDPDQRFVAEIPVPVWGEWVLGPGPEGADTAKDSAGNVVAHRVVVEPTRDDVVDVIMEGLDDRHDADVTLLDYAYGVYDALKRAGMLRVPQ